MIVSAARSAAKVLPDGTIAGYFTLSSRSVRLAGTIEWE
jgi:hypothetical protein